jgi:hypothetical protein
VIDRDTVSGSNPNPSNPVESLPEKNLTPTDAVFQPNHFRPLEDFLHRLWITPALVGAPAAERGSRSTSAVTTYFGGHTYVVPAAAQADVVSGRIDRALFDVTTLLAERRDDASSSTLPVIIRYAGTRAAATAKAKQTAPTGVTKSRALTSIGARAATVAKSATDDFWAALTPATARLTTTVQRISSPASSRGWSGPPPRVSRWST